MIFWLGTHEVHWLGRTDVPLFLSRRRLAKRKRLPRAMGPWALDSGGFSELTMFGRWETSAKVYVEEVRKWQAGIGNMAWAAIQDWMCEPTVRQKTGLSTEEHQRRTVASYQELQALAPDLPWVPVLQGWEYGDYLRHVGMYAKAGIDLAAQPLVGLGSVCRRQQTDMAEDLIRELSGAGIRLHGFGFKLAGLRRTAASLASADSLAWSFQARKRRRPLAGCQHEGSCANCLRYALWWRERVLRAIEGGQSRQLCLW